MLQLRLTGITKHTKLTVLTKKKKKKHYIYFFKIPFHNFPKKENFHGFNLPSIEKHADKYYINANF